MELLASYGKFVKQDSHAVGVVASRDAIGCNGRRFDLRTGRQEPGFLRGIAFSRAGLMLSVGAEGAVVEHPDGRKVPLAREGTGLLEPAFVGGAVVLQDDPARSAGLAVFDPETGALRGRLEHERTVYGTRAMVQAAVCDVGDGERAWVSDRSHLRLWNLKTVRCEAAVAAPSGHIALGVALLPDGALVTSVRPLAGDHLSGELATVRADVWIRKPLVHGSVAVVRDRVCAVVLGPNLKGQSIDVFDATLERVEQIPLAEPLGVGELLALWSDDDEVLAVGWHGQVHHFGPSRLRPAQGDVAEAPKKPAKKPTTKPAKKGA